MAAPNYTLRKVFVGKLILNVLDENITRKYSAMFNKILVRGYSQCTYQSRSNHLFMGRPALDSQLVTGNTTIFALCRPRNVYIHRNVTFLRSNTRYYSSFGSEEGSDEGNGKNKLVSMTEKDSDADVDTYVHELEQMKALQVKSGGHTKLDIPKQSDFVIIGGGSVGLSTAYWLKERNPPGFSLTVIDKDPTYSRASSTLGLASLTQQFSLPENIQMAAFSAKFYRDLRNYVSVLDLDPPDIQFNQQGHLLLARDENALNIMKTNYETQKEFGTKMILLEPNDLKTKFPWLNTDDVHMGSYGLANEGWFDPWLYLAALKIKCLSFGVHFAKGEVTGFASTESDGKSLVEDGKIIKKNVLDTLFIRGDDQETYPIKFAVCVNCAGPSSGEIAAMAGIGKGGSGSMGIALPVQPRKHYVYMFHCPGGPGLDMPMLMDPLGVYVRREGLGGCYICGVSPSADEESPTADLDDHAFFEQHVKPILVHRIPEFVKLELKNAWTSFQDYNDFDQNLVIGNHPYHRNFMMATGAGAHGVQMSPAIGRALAEYSFDNRYTTIDLSRFNFDRIVDNKPVFEKLPYLI